MWRYDFTSLCHLLTCRDFDKAEGAPASYALLQFALTVFIPTQFSRKMNMWIRLMTSKGLEVITIEMNHSCCPEWGQSLNEMLTGVEAS